MNKLTVCTASRDQFINITAEVQQIVTASGLGDGVCVVFVPHTTAGVTINENADPDVVTDILHILNKVVPWQSPYYRHGEGNSAAHIKASLIGNSVHVLVQDGQLQLGTWQGIYFCEFDGPRTRQIWIACQGTVSSLPTPA